MSKLSDIYFTPATHPHDVRDGAAAVFTVYGPRGGIIASGIIGRDRAEVCATVLAEIIDASATADKPDEPICELTARMRRDVDELGRRIEAGEWSIHGGTFMDREAFASLTTGLMRFEYAAKIKAPKVVTDS